MAIRYYYYCCGGGDCGTHNHPELHISVRTDRKLRLGFPLGHTAGLYRARIPTQVTILQTQESFLPAQLLWDGHPKLGIQDYGQRSAK